MDLSIHGSGSQQEDFGQQYLWQDVQENSRHLGPAAAVCSSLLRQYFRERYNYLKDSELLAQTGRVHLFGRAAALGGLPKLIKDIFGMETILGTKQATRDPAAEISGAITVGLVRAAAEERQRQIARRQASSGFHQVASAAGGFWGWLTARVAIIGVYLSADYADFLGELAQRPCKSVKSVVHFKMLT